MNNYLIKEILDQSKDKTTLITLVGGGGKTTTIYRLADHLKKHHRVLVTTTTHMFHPHGNVDQTYLKKLPDDLSLECKAIGLYDAYDVKKDKVSGFSKNLIDEIKHSHQFDYILNEGDGSRIRPLKSYADHEPEIPSSSDIVLVLIGAEALNQPLHDKIVQRIDAFKRVTGISEGDLISEDVLVKLLSQPKGFLKDIPDRAKAYVIINKARSHPLTFDSKVFASKLWKATTRYTAVFLAEMADDQVFEIHKYS